jgi:hypothetical protein
VMALLAVEARRAVSRRLFKVLLLVGAVAVVIVAVLVFVNTSDSPGGFSDDSFNARELVEDDGDAGIIAGTAFVPLLFALVLASSLAGAEWRAGTVPVLLTWEPRRTRVLLAKVTVAALAAAVTVMAIEAFLVVALWPSAVFHGSTAGTDAAFWFDVLEDLLRVGAAGAVVGILSFTIAFLGRNTTAALAVTFAYLVVVENVIRLFRAGWGRWFFTDNLFVFLLGNAEDADVDFTGSSAGSAAVLLVYAAVLILASVGWFRVRDVN